MSWIESFFHGWERRLAFRDDFERRVLPFEWGLEHLPSFASSRSLGKIESMPARAIVHEHVEQALAESDAYFDVSPIADFKLEERRLSFTSPAPSGIEQNDAVSADLFPAPRNGTPAGGPAVLVLPQWNAERGAQEGLCRLLNRYGLTALKLVLPYHENRRPSALARADFALSPNVGRTLQSCRQAVLDARAAIGWLAREGYGPVGVVGTSLGSCIAFIAFAHEPLLDAGVFNHISPFFADVVWSGISTRHVRKGLEAAIELDELRKLWLPLSPHSFYERLRRRCRPSLLIYGRFDLSFPVELSRNLVADFRRLEIEHELSVLPCGHYTTAKFPFNWMDGLQIARFLKKRLAS